MNSEFEKLVEKYADTVTRICFIFLRIKFCYFFCLILLKTPVCRGGNIVGFVNDGNKLKPFYVIKALFC